MIIKVSQPIPHDQPAAIKKASDFIRIYGVILFMSLLILAGLCVGAAYVTTRGGAVPKAFELFISPPWELSGKTPLLVFADSFSVSFFVALLMLFFAATPSGMITVPIVIFLRGCLFGALSGVLAVKGGVAGLGYFVSVVLAGAFLASLSYIYFSQYCLAFSISIMKELFGRIQPGLPLKIQFKELIRSASYLLLMLAFSSLIDTALYMAIGRSFVISGV